MYVETRSILGILSLASHGVIVPDEHKKRGWVQITRKKTGEEFDWPEFLRPIITIRSSKTPPNNAYVSVYFKGYHFYVNNSDRLSKLTLSIISQLIMMNSVSVKDTGPKLTLPL